MKVILVDTPDLLITQEDGHYNIKYKDNYDYKENCKGKETETPPTSDSEPDSSTAI